jgi:hypothetical protein
MPDRVTYILMESLLRMNDGLLNEEHICDISKMVQHWNPSRIAQGAISVIPQRSQADEIHSVRQCTRHGMSRKKS